MRKESSLPVWLVEIRLFIWEAHIEKDECFLPLPTPETSKTSPGIYLDLGARNDWILRDTFPKQVGPMEGAGDPSSQRPQGLEEGPRHKFL